jgi:hypothetical protein
MSTELEPAPDAPELPAVVDDLSRINELIAGDSPEPAQDAGEADLAAAAEPPLEPETGDDEPEPAAADDEPEPAAAIDYDALIPMPDGAEPISIGALKDHYQNITDFTAERETWESTRMEQDNQLIAAKQELYTLGEMMGTVRPEVVAHIRQQRAASQETEKGKLLEVFPQWADPAVKKADSPALVSTLLQYGYSEADFAGIADHRHIKILSDLSKLQARDKAGREKAAAVKVDLPKGQKSVQRKQSKAQAHRSKMERAKSGTEADKNAAIGSLIDGV